MRSTCPPSAAAQVRSAAAALLLGGVLGARAAPYQGDPPGEAWVGGSQSPRTGFVASGGRPPRAQFSATPTTGSAALAVAFTDLSSPGPTLWLWDFGDGAQSAEPEPTHVYSSPGLYSVTLTVCNASGSTTSEQPNLIKVTGAPELAIEYGMNSNENIWAQRAIAFADGMARASEFLRVVNGQFTPQLAPVIPLGQEPPLLGAGWPDFFALPPGERPGARLFGSMGGSIPDGRTLPYVMTWEGTGSCLLDGPPVLAEANRTANRVEVFIDPQGGGGNATLGWILDSSSASDPVRNVQIWLPGMEAQKPIFWPPFLVKLQAMSGGRGPHTWRTMDWSQIRQYGRTSGAAPFVFDLAGRITPASPSQGTRRGVCPEFQVALCNAVGANLHFCLPHQADQISDADYETFVREALLVIRDGSPAVPGVNGGQPLEGLAPGRTVMLSYSNEIWNSGFPVYAWMQARAQANGVSFHRQIALETERVFSIADEVFSGADAARLQKYVGGWIADPDFVAGILSELSPGTQVDAIGCAGYLRPLSTTISDWLVGAVSGDCPNCPTPEEVVEASLLSIPVIAARLQDHREVADSYPNPDGSTPAIELYEGGAAYVAGLQPWLGAANMAQTIPSMYDAYVDHLVPTFVQAGVRLVNWYSFVSSNTVSGTGGVGPFGHWDNMNETISLPVPEVYVDEGAPKAAAICREPPRAK